MKLLVKNRRGLVDGSIRLKIDFRFVHVSRTLIDLIVDG